MAGKGKPGPEPGTGAKQVNKEQVLELCRRQWHVTGIAAFFGMDKSTLYRHVEASEMEEARLQGVARLREALFTRAMGGRVEKKNEDGTVTVSYLKSSDRLLKHALDRFDGAVKQTVELNPDPDRPQNVKHSIPQEQLDAALAKLDGEY